MTAPRVTVVLLTHDCGHRLAAVLRELTALGVPLLAVDNASSDDTVAVLDRAGVTTVRLERNVGAAARNVGAARARTPYVAFCDDDGWYEAEGLRRAADLLDAHPLLGLVNARIVVEPDGTLDPISAEMAASPLPERDGIPGAVLLSFMGGAAIVRRDAWLAVGGYDPRWFLGGEEETVAMPLVRAGWRLRYVPQVVVHHAPSLASFTTLRAHGMRNTLCTAWLHRRLPSALRWTLFTLADNPRNRDWLRGVGLTLRALPAVLRERDPMPRPLDTRYGVLDRRRFAARRERSPRCDTGGPSPDGALSRATPRCQTPNDHAKPPRPARRRRPAARRGGAL